MHNFLAIIDRVRMSSASLPTVCASSSASASTASPASTLSTVFPLRSSFQTLSTRVLRAATSRVHRRHALAVVLCLASLPVLADVTLQRGPPPPRFENPPAAPKGQFWVPGYWQWKDGRYDWVDGHMEARRPGMRYTAPHWEETGEHQWTLREGKWDRSGWGPGTIHEIRAPE
ncbi:putative signal peptide protein [Pandoraea pnomenusa]|uniref:Signal peptide protein n=1 Tax=Pandoraea pnomenusa TaxID=93220 RepID=A0A378YWC6_9BURK|nr:Uncharacterised protein [Pandoraea pnomenusa]VVE63512.1 putative signal peptide protein [Pandoraea pnomenusa]